MTFLGTLPSSARRTASNSSTARSISALTASRETVTSARFLPLICTGSVMVFSTSRAASTCGQAASATRPPLFERRPAFLGQMRHHRREQNHHDFNGFPHGRRIGGADPAVLPRGGERNLQFVRQLVDVRHATVEAQFRDFVGDLGERRRARPCAAPEPRPRPRLRFPRRRRFRRPRAPAATASARSASDPCTPSSVQITSRSGGESDSMNQRATSAPYSPMMSSGSTVFRFDFDIFSIEPIFTSSPVAISVAWRPVASLSIFTSAGVT